MDNLTTSVYTLDKRFVLLNDEEDWWAFDVYYVDVQNERSEVAVNLRNLRDPYAFLELSVLVGQMSQTNCASLVNLAKSGTLKFYLNLIWDSPADGVVGRLHEQGIVEFILDHAFGVPMFKHGGH